MNESHAPGRASVHEAGHTLLAVLLAKDPLDEPIVTGTMGNDAGWTAWAGIDPFVSVTIAMAGGVALDLYMDDDPWRGADDDLALARDMAESMNPDQTALLMTSAREQARAILGERRGPLVALAHALEVNGGRLAGPEVTASVEWALQGRIWSRGAAFDAMVAERARIEARVAYEQALEAHTAANLARVEALREELFQAAAEAYRESHYAEPDDIARAMLWKEAEERAINTIVPLTD